MNNLKSERGRDRKKTLEATFV